MPLSLWFDWEDWNALTDLNNICKVLIWQHRIVTRHVNLPFSQHITLQDCKYSCSDSLLPFVQILSSTILIQWELCYAETARRSTVTAKSWQRYQVLHISAWPQLHQMDMTQIVVSVVQITNTLIPRSTVLLWYLTAIDAKMSASTIPQTIIVIIFPIKVVTVNCISHIFPLNQGMALLQTWMFLSLVQV